MNKLNFLSEKVLKVELDQERLKIQNHSDKLRLHEKELILAKEELRKRELEINSQVQDAKIATENKYRVINDDVKVLNDLFYPRGIYRLCWKKSFSRRWRYPENVPKLKANWF